MQLVTKLPLLLTITLLSSCATTDKSEPEKPLRFDASLVSPTPSIASGCEMPQLDGPRKDFTRPDYPEAQIRSGNSGFAVLDFQINANGKPEHVEIVAGQPAKAFTDHSATALKKLKFSVSPKWVEACSSQKFRIGYQYAFNAECDPKVFPSGMQNVCTTGYIVRM